MLLDSTDCRVSKLAAQMAVKCLIISMLTTVFFLYYEIFNFFFRHLRQNINFPTFRQKNLNSWFSTPFLSISKNKVLN